MDFPTKFLNSMTTYNALEKWESDKRETQIFDSLAASELIRQLNK